MKKLPRIYDVDDNMRLQKIAKKAASKDRAGLQYGQHPELKWTINSDWEYLWA